MSSRKLFLVAAVACAVVLTALFLEKHPEFVSAQTLLTGCPPQNSQTLGWTRGTSSISRRIVYYSIDLTNDPERSEVKAAFDLWNSTTNCLNISFVHRESAPDYTFLTGDAQDHPAVSYYPSAGLLIAAYSVIDVDNVGAQLGKVFFNRNDLANFKVAVRKTALHEIGHTMGLGEMPSNGDAATCGGQTAGKSVMNGMCGTNDGANNSPTSVQPCDTQSINQNLQCSTQSSGGGGSSSGCPSGWQPTQFTSGGSGGPCPSGSTYYNGSCCTSTPVILDLDGNGIQFSDITDGVLFDIGFDGRPDRVAWPVLGSEDAWLVLDRDGDGFIRDGTELFGNFTEQQARTCTATNGFLALAEFDKPEKGGNGDGVMDSRDQAFEVLRLWQDVNRNGVSEASELFPLLERGVSAIELSYHEASRKDRFGNILRYRSKVNSRASGTWAYDVIPLVEPPPE